MIVNSAKGEATSMQSEYVSGMVLPEMRHLRIEMASMTEVFPEPF